MGLAARGDLLAGTLVYHHGPNTFCSELLAGFAGQTSVGAFLPLCPTPMSELDRCASKSRFKIIDATGSHQNGKHLLGPSPASEDTHEKESFGTEEEAKLMNVEVENQHK